MPADSESNRRRAERFPSPVPVRIALVVESHVSQTEHPADLLDTSEKGLRIKTGVELIPGATVDVIMEGRANRVLQSRVVWVGERGSKLEGQVGLEVLRLLL